MEQFVNSGIVSQVEPHHTIVDIDSSVVSSATSDRLTFVTTILTFGISVFHASLTTRGMNLTLGDVHLM